MPDESRKSLFEPMFATGQRIAEDLTSEEADGLRRLLRDPQPPTEALRRAFSSASRKAFGHDPDPSI